VIGWEVYYASALEALHDALYKPITTTTTLVICLMLEGFPYKF